MSLPYSSIDSTDRMISPELIGHLRSPAANVIDVAEGLSADQLADVAALCWRRAHLHDVGLAIAARCDGETLVQRLGAIIGTALFEQSRSEQPQHVKTYGTQRSRITLATGRRPMSPGDF